MTEVLSAIGLPKSVVWLLGSHPLFVAFVGIAVGLWFISFNERLRSGEAQISTGKANLVVIGVILLAIWVLK